MKLLDDKWENELDKINHDLSQRNVQRVCFWKKRLKRAYIVHWIRVKLYIYTSRFQLWFWWASVFILHLISSTCAYKFVEIGAFCLVARPILQQKGFSVILSDMCPLVSGITTRDAVLSAELGLRALDLAVGGGALPHSNDNVQTDGQSDGSVSAPGNNGVLQPGGHLVIKLLESEEIKGKHSCHAC